MFSSKQKLHALILEEKFVVHLKSLTSILLSLSDSSTKTSVFYSMHSFLSKNLVPSTHNATQPAKLEIWLWHASGG